MKRLLPRGRLRLHGHRRQAAPVETRTRRRTVQWRARESQSSTFSLSCLPVELKNGNVCLYFLIEPCANIETDHALSGILLARSPGGSLASHQTTPQMFARERRSHHVLLQQIERRSEQNEIFH